MIICTMRQMEQGVLYGNSGCGFLKILHNERGQGFKNYSSCFHEKNLCLGQMDNFGTKMKGAKKCIKIM